MFDTQQIEQEFNRELGRMAHDPEISLDAFMEYQRQMDCALRYYRMVNTQSEFVNKHKNQWPKCD